MKHISRILIVLALTAIMGTWGCAGKTVTNPDWENIPKNAGDLLKGNAKIHVEGIIERDRTGFIEILIGGHPDRFPQVAGLTICIGGVCKVEAVPVMFLRYYYLEVPALSYFHRSLIPVAVGLSHIVGIDPVTGRYKYEREPFVERRLQLEYRSTWVESKKLDSITFQSCLGVCRFVEGLPQVQDLSRPQS